MNDQNLPSTDKISLEYLDQIADAFNRHDLDAILNYFAEDGIFLLARGPNPWGTRLVGKAEIRKVLSKRFSTIHDMRWETIGRWVNGNKAVSEWVVTGTTENGERLEYFGCDLWEFKNGQIVKKDTYWKCDGPAK